MLRWPVLAVSSTLLLLGCTPSQVTVGLANGPRLGDVPSSDQVIRDAVSNGDDSCGRFGEAGPLRARIPACFGERARPVAPPSPATAAAADQESQSDLVDPWLEHFYAHFPCANAKPVELTGAVAWSDAPRLLCPQPAQ